MTNNTKDEPFFNVQIVSFTLADTKDRLPVDTTNLFLVVCYICLSVQDLVNKICLQRICWSMLIIQKKSRLRT
jgi:predicted HAD superfamily hydrolase